MVVNRLIAMAIVVALHSVGGSGERRRSVAPDLVHPLNELCGGFVRCVGGDDFWSVWVVAMHEVESVFSGQPSTSLDAVHGL